MIKHFLIHSPNRISQKNLQKIVEIIGKHKRSVIEWKETDSKCGILKIKRELKKDNIPVSNTQIHSFVFPNNNFYNNYILGISKNQQIYCSKIPFKAAEIFNKITQIIFADSILIEECRNLFPEMVLNKTCRCRKSFVKDLFNLLNKKGLNGKPREVYNKLSGKAKENCLNLKV